MAVRIEDRVDGSNAGRGTIVEPWAPVRTYDEIRSILAERGQKLTCQGVRFILKRAEAKLVKRLRELQ